MKKLIKVLCIALALLTVSSTAFATDRPWWTNWYSQGTLYPDATYNAYVPCAGGLGCKTSTDANGFFTDTMTISVPPVGYMVDDGAGQLTYVPVTVDMVSITASSYAVKRSCGRYCSQQYTTVLSNAWVAREDGSTVVTWGGSPTPVAVPLEIGPTGSIYTLNVFGQATGGSPTYHRGFWKVYVTSPWLSHLTCDYYQFLLEFSNNYTQQQITDMVNAASVIVPPATLPVCTSNHG